jgi:hypothetical protein
MLTSGKLGRKSADINGLFVALARAAGLPARVLYGVRVAPSAFGYTSLGADGPDVTREQHCRAEVFLSGFGWVPADPADVRHVIAAEPPGHLTLDDQVVIDARTALFGAWETNWVAYNDGQSVALPGSELGPVPFLLYPQAEVGNARRDSLAADSPVHDRGQRTRHLGALRDGDDRERGRFGHAGNFILGQRDRAFRIGEAGQFDDAGAGQQPQIRERAPDVSVGRVFFDRRCDGDVQTAGGRAYDDGARNDQPHDGAFVDYRYAFFRLDDDEAGRLRDRARRRRLDP